MVLTGSTDGTARLWDAATGQPIGPRFYIEGFDSLGSTTSVVFSPENRAILTGNRLLHLPADLTDDLDYVELWFVAATGLQLQADGSITALDPETWHRVREQLQQRGGQPYRGSTWLRDPVLFGPNPTERARAWVKPRALGRGGNRFR